MNLQLLSTKKVVGRIKVVSGLHIGWSSDIIEIGGLDNVVIKDTRTGDPYIPGSSLKGRMRAILEWRNGKIGRGGGPCDCGEPNCPACRIFGTASSEGKGNVGPTRVLVRDAMITPESRKQFLEEEPHRLTEVKYENTIDRVTGTAKNPRGLERVLPGIEFSVEILYRVFDVDGDGGETDKKMFENVLTGLSLVEDDALGGCSSRGCGKVKFIDLKDESGNDIDLDKYRTS